MAEALSQKISPEELKSAVHDVIYYLDMGVFIPKSNVILANLDESIDEGVAVEVCFAKTMGKFVIGFRTDVRSPYGDGLEPLKGMHFFPAYQCDVFLGHYMISKSIEEANNQMKYLVDKIDDVIKNEDLSTPYNSKENVLLHPYISEILKGANFLFDRIDDVHSEDGLKEVSQRYVKYKEELNKMRPKIKG